MQRRNTILSAGMSKRLLGVLVLVGWTFCASASYFTGGDKKKDAHKDTPVNLTFSNLRNKNTLQLSLKTGLQYGLQFTGGYDPSLLQTPPPTVVHSLMTYQKGNTIFVFPYKPSIFVTKFKTPERVLR